jgi:hypothetical protein
MSDEEVVATCRRFAQAWWIAYAFRMGWPQLTGIRSGGRA